MAKGKPREREAAPSFMAFEDLEKHINYTKMYRLKNPDRVKIWRDRAAKKYRSTPMGRLTEAVRSGVRCGILKGSKASRRTFDLLGYTVEELMAHLERQFIDGMTWDNYGQWHIDHIVPLSAHNYETPDDLDFKRAWALENLQPLWAAENISKHARLDKPFQPSLAISV